MTTYADEPLEQEQEPGPDPFEETALPVPVDPPARTKQLEEWLRGTAEGTQRPVLPEWFRDASQRTVMARSVAGYAWHRVKYHTVRAPWYLVKLLACAPIGAFRIIGAVLRWVDLAETAELRRAAVLANDFDQWKGAHDRQQDVASPRAIIAGALAVTILAASIWVWVNWPPFITWPAAAALWVWLGIKGAPQGKPLIGPAVIKSEAPRLTCDLITAALASLGLGKLNTALRLHAENAITYPSPITRDGPGWRADVDLPIGVTAADVMAKEESLASGLRRTRGQVWTSGDPEQHEGRLVLWVGDVDFAKALQPAWPLRTGTADYFKPIPFGTDPRGRPIEVTLFENNFLIGSLPGGGKTAAVRGLALAAALDPTVKLLVYELKGSGDLRALERVAHVYGSGIDDQTIEGALIMLRELRADLQTRSIALSEQPRDRCPDGKVTRHLADQRSLGLPPIVAVIDEVHNLFAHPSYGKEAGQLATEIIKVGRAYAVTLVLATQRPDKASLPTGVSGNTSVRFCLRVMGHVENDMILGTSMHRNGIRATGLRPTDRGIGYLVGAYDDPRVVRTYYLDLNAAEKHAQRARAMREADGRLSGFAVTGENGDSAPRFDLLADIIAVAGHETSVWSSDLCERLADYRPDAYANWTPATLAAAVKPLGLETVQLNRQGRNQRGVRLADVRRILDRRSEE